MKRINILQYTPYLPPHIWGVEKVVRDTHDNWTFWESKIVSGDMWLYWEIQDENIITFPSIDIIPNFPLPKFWKKDFWMSIKKIKSILKEDEYVIITHTRFFLPSLMWWIIARRNKCKWIHIEHGSDFVELSSPSKTKIAYFYDMTIGKYILRKSDRVLAISEASKKFIGKIFWRRNIHVWYRGIDIPKSDRTKVPEIRIVFAWRLVHIKWVSDLIAAYGESDLRHNLVIIWDGEERDNLQKQCTALGQQDRVEFTWWMTSWEVCKYLGANKCIFVNPSYQEWMPTWVIEALSTKNVVIATNVWGTSEISSQKDLLLYKQWDIENLVRLLKYWVENYESIAWKSYDWINSRFSFENSMKHLYSMIDE